MRKFFSVNEPDSMEYLYNLIDMLSADSKIEQHLKKNISNYTEWKHSMQKGRKLYMECQHLRKMIEESKNSSFKKVCYRKLQNISSQLPVVKYSVLQGVYFLVEGTDLSRLPIPLVDHNAESRRRVAFSQESVFDGM